MHGFETFCLFPSTVGNVDPTTPGNNHNMKVDVFLSTKIITEDKTPVNDNKGSKSQSFKAYNKKFDIIWENTIVNPGSVRQQLWNKAGPACDDDCVQDARRRSGQYNRPSGYVQPKPQNNNIPQGQSRKLQGRETATCKGANLRLLRS